MLNPRLRAPTSSGRMAFLRIILVIACCAAGFQARNGYGDTVDIPPIDCRAPKDPLDSEICADKAMKEWWWEALYRDTLTLNPERREAINATEKDWMALRNECAAPDLTMDCAYALYDEPIEALLKEGIQPLWLHAAANPAQARRGTLDVSRLVTEW